MRRFIRLVSRCRSFSENGEIVNCLKDIAAGSSDNRIYLLNLRGNTLWRYITSGNVMGVSVSQEGYLAAGSLDGKLYFFRIIQ